MAGLPRENPARRTFLLDSLRAVPGGFLETLGMTFAVLIAVRFFDAGQHAKATLVASGSTGLLLSLFVVPLVRRYQVSVNRACAVIWFASAAALLLAATLGTSEGLFVLFVSLALIGVTLGIPLLAQIYRKHYPGSVRGRLFAISATVRKVSAIVVAAAFGWALNRDLSLFPWLLWGNAVAAALTGVAVLGMDDVHLARSERLRVFSAFRHLKLDPLFRKLLVSWMILGLGNLLCFSLFVEYVANPEYGYDLSEFMVSFLTGALPEFIFLLFVVAWGIVFDRVDFFLLRLLLNLIFIAGILVFFLGHGVWALAVGISLHSLARSGGNIAWSLWATRFAKADHVAEYMSLHTFFCGVRGVLAPFVAFPVAASFSPQVVACLGAGLIAVASLMLAPHVRFRLVDADAAEAVPNPRVG